MWSEAAGDDEEGSADGRSDAGADEGADAPDAHVHGGLLGVRERVDGRGEVDGVVDAVAEAAEDGKEEDGVWRGRSGEAEGPSSGVLCPTLSSQRL